MALDPNYGTRIQGYAEQAYPQAFAPPPPLTITRPTPAELPTAAPPTAAPGSKGFPGLVAERQGTGPKLDAATLEALKEQYLIETVMPRETAKKGSDKAAHDAAQAAYNSKADRWIQDYLKQQAGAQAAADSSGNGRGFAMGAAQGSWDTLVSAVKGLTTDTISGIGSLADYGLRKVKGDVGGGATALMELLRGGSTTDAINKGAATSNRLAGQNTFLGTGSDSVSQFGNRIADEFTSEATLKARKGLEDLLAQDASASQIAAYIAANPSSASGYLGETIGMIAPALLTGGATAAVRGSSVVGNLAKGGRVSRIAGRALENAPAILAAGAAPTGNAVGDLRQAINEAPLDQLLDSQGNKALYESLQEMGLSGERLNTRFREALFVKAQDVTLAGAAASNILLPGVLGAPAERALANIVTGSTRGNVLKRVAQTAAGEGAQEAVSAIPDTLSQNIAQGQYTGTEVPVTQGLANNALLSGALGAVVGGGVAIPGNALRRAPTEQAPSTTEAPTAAPVAPTAASTQQAPAPVGPVSITEAPGSGIGEAAANTLAKQTVEAAALVTARKTGKQAVQKLDAGGVITQAQAIAEQTAGDQWASMTPAERLDMVEGAAETLNKQAKKEEVAATLAALRGTLVQPPITPAGSVPPAVETVPPAALETPPAAVVPPTAAPVAPVTPEAAPAPVAEAPTPVSAPVEAPPVAPEALPKLPTALAGAKPRWNNGAAAYAPQFESDVDKALYIVGQTTKSKNDGEYRKFLEQQGFASNRIDELAKTVRASVRFYMEQSPPGTNTTPAKVVMPATNVLTEAGAVPAKKTNPLKSSAPKVPPAPKTNRLKKATPPPKTEAPAEEPGQAVPAAPEQTPTPTRESGRDAVVRIAPELSRFDQGELSGAIELAREGDTQLLNNVTSGLQRTKDISREQAIALRKEGEARTPAQEGLTTNETIELAAPKGWSTADTILNNGLVLGRAIQTALKSDSKTKVGDVLRAFDTAKNDVGPMQAWLAKKLAPIVDKLGVTLLEVPDDFKTAAGAYQFVDNGIWIRQPIPEIILHEALHGVTSSLLATSANSPEAKQFQREFGDLLAHVQDYVRENPDAVTNDWLKTQVANSQGFLSNTRELLAYGMTSGRVQDFLATIPAPENRKKATNAWQEFKNILARLFESLVGKLTVQQRSALDALIESTAGLVEYAGLNPVEAKVAQMNASKKVLEARAKSADEIDEDAIDFAQVDPQEPKREITNADVRPVSIAQRLGELFSQAAYGLERSEQELRKVGGEVTPETSPYYASRKYTSDIAENRNTDNMEVVQPIENWIATNWRDFKSNTLDDFRSDLDKFLQNYHALNERNPSVWANTVELKNGMELQRAKLIDDAYEDKLTGPELDSALMKLAEKNAAEPLETWAASNAARDPKRARDVLADVAKRGFTPEKLAGLNDLLKVARDRARARMDASGITSAEDPFADRGWKWYVPLKGSLSVGEEAADFDIGARKGSTKEFRQRNLRTLEGRSTNADNALEQLIVDMNDAATAQAEAEFKSTIFEYVNNNLKTLGAKIRRWEGTPKQGYTAQVTYTKKGKSKIKERFRRELPNPKSGFIYNDGLNHYEVTLPDGSQLDRGIKGIRSIATPSTFEESNRPIAAGFRALGTATNILARNYTTWSPTWQLTTAFLRDVNALPLTVAVEAFDSPWQARLFAAQYTKNMLSNMLDLRNALAELKAVNGDKSAMAKYAKDHPNSYVSKLLAYREAGGSTEFSQGLNRTKAGELLFDKARRQDADLISLGTVKTGYNKWNELTGNWAAMLENKGRVAAWEALKATGMDAKQAAAIVKGALDYGQSGEWGKLINIVHAFYRIGATSIDTMRRAFSKPDGSPDMPKIAKWMPVMGAMGAIAYTLLGAILGDDEDGVPKIKKITADTLTQKLILPDGKGDVLSVPIGLGLPQLMMAPGILGAAVAQGNISSEEAAKAYYETITRNTPIQPGGVRKGSGATGFVQSWLQGILVPSVAMPISESVANTNAFDSPIRTDFPNKNKYASDQGMPDTPAFWKDVAGTTREVVGIDMYPETLRHFVKGWGGQPANNVIRWTLDFDNKEQQGMDSRAVRTALRLGVSDADFYYRNEARKALDELTISKRNLNSALKNGEDEAKWLRAHPNDAKRMAEYKALDSARDAYYKRKAAIRDNKLMTPQGKKEQLKLADSKLREAVNKAQRVIEATED